MGVSTSAGQLAGKLEHLAIEIGNPTPAINVTALQAKQVFLATAASHKALGNVAGRRKAIGARYNLGRKGKANAWAVVLYTGPAHLLNNPTKAHEILPRRRPGVRTRRKGAKALRFADDEFAASAHHPGTKGKHFFEEAKAIVEKQAPTTFAKAGLTEPLHRAFH
jgi:hypothetical protein